MKVDQRHGKPYETEVLEIAQYTGRIWLEYRLRTLIVKGDLSSMRLYEVKC